MDATFRLSSHIDVSGFNMPTLTIRMKQASDMLHAQVEGRPFLQQIMQGTVSKDAYIQYLANLACIYGALEEALEANCDDKALAPLCISSLYRSNKIAQDLKIFKALGLAPSILAQKHAMHIDQLKNSKPHLLIAHAYTRYLGDLYGGQYIGKAVADLWGEEYATFYNYAELMEERPIESLAEYAQSYRALIDNIELSETEEEAIIQETIKAFQLADEMIKELA